MMSADEWQVLVLFVRNHAGLAETLLSEHVDDGSGHCRGCTLPQSGTTRWPCTIFTLAADASPGRRHLRIIA